MKGLLILFLFFNQLVYGEVFADKCVTHGELKKILHDLVASVEVQKKLEDNYRLKLERAELSKTLRLLTFPQIDEKMRLYEQTGKLLEVESRCIFLAGVNYKDISDSLKASVMVRCARNSKKMEKYDDALKKFQSAVDIVQKSDSNEMILKEMMEIYRLMGNKQKELEIKNLLFD